MADGFAFMTALETRGLIHGKKVSSRSSRAASGASTGCGRSSIPSSPRHPTARGGPEVEVSDERRFS
jgi:hypothetical protein